MTKHISGRLSQCLKMVLQIRKQKGEPELNYLCVGDKAFFRHIDRPMRIMAQLLRRNRAPAEVMLIVATEEAQVQQAFTKAGRNDRYPCGNGHKCKPCHGREERPLGSRRS